MNDWPVLVGVTLGILIGCYQCSSDSACEKARGVYLWREDKCIEAKEIKP